MSTGPATVLREVHRLRKFTHELREQIDRAPRLRKAQEARVAHQEAALREAQDGLKKRKVALNDKEVTLKGTHASLAKHGKQLNESGSSSEYAALQHQIDTEKAKAAALEDEILAAMTEIEEHAARLPGLEQQLKTARDELANFASIQEERVTKLRAEMERAGAELAEVEKTLPADVKPQVDRLMAARGHDAFSAVANNTCAACYNGITAEMANDLLQAKFVLCKSCGRMLYPAQKG